MRRSLPLTLCLAPAVCSAVVGRADIGRLLAADSFLDADSPAQQAARFANISAACNYSSWEPEPDAKPERRERVCVLV
eukprot:COSAG04_NODE_6680_length_1279_cov_1.072881_1_plen_78_part_00